MVCSTHFSRKGNSMTYESHASAKAMPRFNVAALLLALCMFTTGASGLVNEYVLATTTTYILGNSIEQFSIVIALMMLAMGVAGYYQKSIKDDWLVGVFIGFQVCLALLSAFAPIALYAAYGMMSDHFNLVLYALVFAIGLLIGFEIPIVVRLMERSGLALKSNLALTYFADYIGAFVGAMVWIYVLLKYVPLTEISFWVAGSNFVVASIAAAFFIRRGVVSRPFFAAAALVATAVLLVVGLMQNRDWNLLLEQQFYEDPIVMNETTQYQHLILTHNPQLSETRLYINGNTQFSSLDEMIYHEQLVHPAMTLATSRRHVLILGGGDGLALREVLKYQDVETVTLVDLDPGMISLASTNPLLTELNQNAFADARVSAQASSAVSDSGIRPIFDELEQQTASQNAVTTQVASVHVFTVDADRFLSDVGDAFNVVIIDLPDPNSIELVKLYSKEFYTKLRHHLAKGGMVVVQSTSPYHASESYLAIGRTMQAAGFDAVPYHDNVPSFGDWGWYLASRADESERPLLDRASDLKEIEVSTRYLTPDVFRKGLVFGKDWLETKNTDVNTWLHPVLLGYYLDQGWKVE